ncbi:hypothetical protein ACFP1I_15740 [Dyadobacter subterraneus]|uniref:Uncharacterized protein n=1 Tax=Dyadobacter subterraneus TaxID=2773304 RepID=A0ABR9WI56_9BACT|nr:hypothetical protein [Dyadobacter subterraneus]MBE9465191.1 hypothetical protein [Dyadobacter subterraneus]
MENEKTPFRKKWAKWRFIGLAIIALAIFIKFFVLKDEEEEMLAPIVEVDLSKVAFKSEKEVEAILGKGKLDSYWRDADAGCDKCPKVVYRDGKIEIIYIKEIADRITINNLSEYSFKNHIILGLLGLKSDTNPTFENDEVKRWDNYEKYTQIAAFAKKDKLEYILIKSKVK